VTADWDAGAIKVLSSTSYFDSDTKITTDASKQLQPVLNFIFGVPYGATIGDINPVHSLTQEVRLSSPDANRLQWQVGGFFAHEQANVAEPIYPIDPAAKTILYNFNPSFGGFALNSSYIERAGFANLDYHLTPALDVSAGGRYSSNDQRFYDVGTGLFGGGANFGTTSSEAVYTYSADIRWRVTPTNMFYVRVATGYVPGGPNISNPANIGQSSYSSSTDINYEAGIKSEFLEKALSLQLSAFHINWNRIQLEGVTAEGFGVIVNGTSARSDGAEWNLAYSPMQGLTLGFNGAYTQAYLTGPTPASVNGKVDDSLPEVPRWQSSATVNYERPVFGEFSGFAGVSWRFLGNREADFEPTGPRQRIPSNSIVDLRAGVESHKWTFMAYVKNVGNVIAINDVIPETTAGGAGPPAAELYTPRTVGAQVSARF
jgi:iron complex outermembrane receptor protein